VGIDCRIQHDNKARIVQEGALAGLVALLKSPIVNILQHAAATLRNLSVREGNDVKMAVEGALPPPSVTYL
jgi:nitrate/nitrite-specific signal transduction histidine kinase